MFAQSIEQSRNFLVENYTTGILAFMCPEDDVLREHRIVDDYMQNEYTRASIHDWARVVLELYDSG